MALTLEYLVGVRKKIKFGFRSDRPECDKEVRPNSSPLKTSNKNRLQMVDTRTKLSD